MTKEATWCDPVGRWDGSQYCVASAHFDTGSSLLSDYGKRELGKLRALSEQDSSEPVQLLVIGHADYRGSDKFNSHLGHQRAEAVAKYVREQVHGSWWTIAITKGERNARQPGPRSIIELNSGPEKPTGQEMARDRRVDIYSSRVVGRDIKFDSGSILETVLHKLKMQIFTLSTSENQGLYDEFGNPVGVGPRVKGRGALARQARNEANARAHRYAVDAKIEKLLPSMQVEFKLQQDKNMHPYAGQLIVIPRKVGQDKKIENGPLIKVSVQESNGEPRRFFANKETAFEAFKKSRIKQPRLENSTSYNLYLCYWITLAH